MIGKNFKIWVDLHISIFARQIQLSRLLFVCMDFQFWPQLLAYKVKKYDWNRKCSKWDCKNKNNKCTFLKGGSLKLLNKMFGGIFIFVTLQKKIFKISRKWVLKGQPLQPLPPSVFTCDGLNSRLIYCHCRIAFHHIHHLTI